jgi:hypothetical protein
MATNLFAMPGTVGGAAGSTQKPLVEFRAGKMNFDDSTKNVTPDRRKGLIQLTQSPDGLIHFIWKDRTSGIAENDLIVFPDEAVFKHLKQCTTGRVYLLEYKTSSRKLFFWMQEPSDAKDEENSNKINQYMNNPPTPGENTGGAGMGGMDQNALFQMLSGGRPQRSGGASGQQAQGGSMLGVNDLQSILSGIVPPSALSGLLNQRQQQGAAAQPQRPSGQPQPPTQQAPAQGPRPRLSALINPELILPHLSNPVIQQQLIPFLPPEQRTPEELRQVLHSPQFQQSLDAFGDALESGQLGELMRQFGLNTTGPSSIQQFLQAIQNSSPQQPPSGDKHDDNMDTK